ncbi:MAG: phosphoadenosine phosphosulfate reductase family protein [Chlorobiaceae bacterium]|nr:phosphoadenosine phosphosulfate reductase family protein [Chlorobiaceae bacterium]
MKHVVKFSGGAASAVVAKLVIDEIGHDDVILLYSDTKSEHPDADRFRAQICDFLKHEMTVVADGRDLWELIDDNHTLPGQFMPFCTQLLKQRPSDRFLKALGEDFISYLGFSIDEIRRAQRSDARAAANGERVAFPLINAGLSSDDCKRIIRDEWGICLPEPYKYLKHNNCIPCFKAGAKGYWAAIAKHYPEQFERACQAEEKWNYTVFRDITLRQLKDLSGREIEMFPDEDTTPCMCAL